MSRKTTITFTDDLYQKATHEAAAMGLSLNRYVLQRLGAADSVLFINLQELVQGLVCLYGVLQSSRLDAGIRQEVDELCRFCASFLVAMTKKRG